jgi:hypothetical protein
MDQSLECPIFQDGDMAQARKRDYRCPTPMRSRFLTNVVGIYALCPLSQCTRTLCEAGSGRVGAVSGQRHCHVAETNKVHAF